MFYYLLHLQDSYQPVQANEVSKVSQVKINNRLSLFQSSGSNEVTATNKTMANKLT